MGCRKGSRHVMGPTPRQPIRPWTWTWPCTGLLPSSVQGFGVLDKAVFVFDRPFWDTTADFILREMPDRSGRW